MNINITKPTLNIGNYIALGAVLLLCALVIAITARSIFSSMRVANEIDEKLFQNTTPRIDQQQLDNAFKAIDAKDVPSLNPLSQ